jgi:hypothetical protein
MPCNCQQTKQVAQPKAQAVPSNGKTTMSAPPRAQSRPAFVSVRYTGPTSATTTGPVSGRHYNFARNGAIVQVDPRDKAALAKVPHLRQI